MTFFMVLFALLLGLMVGFIGGIFVTSANLLANKSLREYFEKEAYDNYYTNDERL